MAHLSYALNVTRPPKLFVLFSLQNTSTFPFSWNMYVLPKSFDGCDNSTICLHYSPTSVRKNKYGLFLIKMGNLVLFVSTPRSYVVLSDLEHWEQMKVLHAMLASFNIPEISRGFLLFLSFVGRLYPKSNSLVSLTKHHLNFGSNCLTTFQKKCSVINQLLDLHIKPETFQRNWWQITLFIAHSNVSERFLIDACRSKWIKSVIFDHCSKFHFKLKCRQEYLITSLNFPDFSLIVFVSNNVEVHRDLWKEPYSVWIYIIINDGRVHLIVARSFTLCFIDSSTIIKLWKTFGFFGWSGARNESMTLKCLFDFESIWLMLTRDKG